MAVFCDPLRSNNCPKFPVSDGSAYFASAWSAISWPCDCGTSNFFGYKMPFKVNDKTKSRVEALLPLFDSNSELLKKLSKSGPTVSLSYLKRLRRLKRLEAQGPKDSPKKRPVHGNANPDRKSHVKKIARWTGPKNPLTISEMARRLGMSRWYVRNILKNTFGVHQVKKRMV